ncbi:amidohydrolase family protein [Actinoplanes sp. CA-030573]|uniref:amidohydrolase family protein n=1 Tax=Actinoplanes sp. CA-030573 TaxID=3239898 RepID=UPI003D8C962C
MIVDAHHHLWRVDQGYAWLDEPSLAPIRRTFTPDDLRDELKANGVSHTVLVEGGRCDTGEARLLLAFASDVSEISGVVAWGDPADPGLADTIEEYRGLPGGEHLVGIRAQVQAFGERAAVCYLDRDDVRRGLATVGEAGLAFDLVIRADQIASAARAATALPGVRFVLDHLGKPPIRERGFDRWAADLGDLAACPNVTAKLSGLVTEAAWTGWTADDLRPYVLRALELFGAGRLMFGSDWPVCTLASTYGKWLSTLNAILPRDARAEVLGGTAVRTYHLSLA